MSVYKKVFRKLMYSKTQEIFMLNEKLHKQVDNVIMGNPLGLVS